MTFLSSPDARAKLDAWWDELTAQRVVVLLVDDLARADRPSVQQLLLLAEASKRRRLLIVVCVGTGESGLERELKPLLKMGCTAKLRPLSLVETELLLRSMFGDMPHMDALASWVHSAAAGIPAACVELAHYALARGVVCHRSGQFQVAGDLALLELPAAYDDAIAARVRALSPQAREALGALALLTPFGPLSDPEHIELFGNAAWPQAQALAALDELRDAQLLRAHHEGYELHSEAVRRIAKAELGADGVRFWHERIGSFYQRRGHARGMLAALHLEYAGERQRAYDQLLPLDANIEGPEDPNIPLGGSALGIALHQAMLAHAVAIGNRVAVLHFRRILLELAATTNPSLGGDGLDLLQQLRIDAGLDFWDQAPSEYSEQQKMFYCLARGHERHLSTPAEERGLPVADAVRILAQSASVLVGICASTFDRVTATELLRIIEPLRTLAPVLALTYRQLEFSKLAFTRGGRMTERWNESLALLETRPEGMRELIWRYVISNLQCAVAREAATRGDPSYQVHAANLGQLRRRQTQVLSLHLLFALAHGRFDQSKRLRREVEISALASRHEDQLVAFARIDELELLEACGDLLELQRLSQWFDARARRYPGWLPFAASARAAGLLLCDQPQGAEAVLAAQLEAAPVLQHCAWYALRALRAEAILHAGNAALARELAEEIVRQAAAAEVDVSANTRAQRVLALASAALGDAASAHAILEPLMREAESATTVRAGQILEARARVALFCSDRATFQRCLARVREIYSLGGYPGLIARLERLQAAGRRAFDGQAEPSAAERLSMLSDRSAAPYEGLQLELERLAPTERALYLLTMLLADCGATAGKLYHVSAAGAVSLVQVRLAALDESVIDDGVSDYVSRITALSDETTYVDMDDGPEATLVSSTLLADDMAYTVVALRDRSGALRGVALVRADSRAAKPTCSPDLCVSVATALGSWF